eukprot:GHRR01026097.1.p1 GENE.GHRR01026097.1~~GHRR01026097.1.p1  ORF type:complete len:159 (-),score=49.30 GHRR01026097.1:291-767(-)
MAVPAWLPVVALGSQYPCKSLTTHAWSACRVSWHAQELVLNPQDPLLPLQVVSGTHLDINFTALPPINSSTCDAANSSLAVLNPTTPRVGLVFKSWRDGGNGAAVLSFDWADHSLVIDFDEPFPDAYNPFPEDTPNRRRIGGKLRNYAPGMYTYAVIC